MNHLLSLLAIVFGAAAAAVPALLAFIPAFGPRPFYHLRTIRISLLIVSWILGLVAFACSPGVISVVSLALTAVFTFIALRVLDPARFIRALSNPPHQLASDLQLGDDAMMMTLTHEGRAYAWPLEVLIPHHIINDHLVDLPVLVSWCAACRSGLIYHATLEGYPRLTFTLAGVWRRNMVIRDMQTGSIWQQDTGECVAGPLMGEHLVFLGGVLVNVGAWRAENPDGLIAQEPDPPVRGLFDNETWFRLFDKTRHFVIPGRKSLDNRLSAHEEVVGIRLNGEARAYPLKALRERGTIEDVLGGESIAIHYEEGAGRVCAFRDGKNLPVQREWWLGWSEFHPYTSVYVHNDGQA